jgi:formate/nitrite transporter FocA (FNT family)
MAFSKLFILGILAGVYIGFGANLATKIGSMEAAGTSGGQFLFGATFSIGLMMVVIAGSELFTGNNMACFISAMNGQAGWGGLLYNWVVVWTANFVGSVLLVYIIFYGGFWGSESGLAAHGIKALGIGHCTTSECCPQTGDSNGVSETGAMVHIIGTYCCSHKFLGQIIFFVGNPSGGEHG